MSARYVIAEAAARTPPVESRRPGDYVVSVHRDFGPTADAIISALTSAGYRILAPGELDATTVEACAKVADDEDGQFTWAGTTRVTNERQALASEIAAAIRSMKGQDNG